MSGWMPTSTCANCGKSIFAPSVRGWCGACEGYPTFSDSLPKWSFGTIVASDNYPFKAMVVAPYAGKRHLNPPPNWWCLVLEDNDPNEDARWKIGDMVTLSPDNRGIRIVASPEETE